MNRKLSLLCCLLVAFVVNVSANPVIHHDLSDSVEETLMSSRDEIARFGFQVQQQSADINSLLRKKRDDDEKDGDEDDEEENENKEEKEEDEEEEEEEESSSSSSSISESDEEEKEEKEEKEEEETDEIHAKFGESFTKVGPSVTVEANKRNQKEESDEESSEESDDEENDDSPSKSSKSSESDEEEEEGKESAKVKTVIAILEPIVDNVKQLNNIPSDYNDVISIDNNVPNLSSSASSSSSSPSRVVSVSPQATLITANTSQEEVAFFQRLIVDYVQNIPTAMVNASNKIDTIVVTIPPQLDVSGLVAVGPSTSNDTFTIDYNSTNLNTTSAVKFETIDLNLAKNEVDISNATETIESGPAKVKEVVEQVVAKVKEVVEEGQAVILEKLAGKTPLLGMCRETATHKNCKLRVPEVPEVATNVTVSPTVQFAEGLQLALQEVVGNETNVIVAVQDSVQLDFGGGVGNAGSLVTVNADSDNTTVRVSTFSNNDAGNFTNNQEMPIVDLPPSIEIEIETSTTEPKAPFVEESKVVVKKEETTTVQQSTEFVVQEEETSTSTTKAPGIVQESETSVEVEQEEVQTEATTIIVQE